MTVVRVLDHPPAGATVCTGVGELAELLGRLRRCRVCGWIGWRGSDPSSTVPAHFTTPAALDSDAGVGGG